MHHIALADAVCMRGPDLLGIQEAWRTAAQGYHHPGLGTPAGVEAYPPLGLPGSSMTEKPVQQLHTSISMSRQWLPVSCLFDGRLEAAEALFAAAFFRQVAAQVKKPTNGGQNSCVQCCGYKYYRRELGRGRQMEVHFSSKALNFHTISAHAAAACYRCCLCPQGEPT